jgi:hypothetical protein
MSSATGPRCRRRACQSMAARPQRLACCDGEVEQIWKTSITQLKPTRKCLRQVARRDCVSSSCSVGPELKTGADGRFCNLEHMFFCQRFSTGHYDIFSPNAGLTPCDSHLKKAFDQYELLLNRFHCLCRDLIAAGEESCCVERTASQTSLISTKGSDDRYSGEEVLKPFAANTKCCKNTC